MTEWTAGGLQRPNGPEMISVGVKEKQRKGKTKLDWAARRKRANWTWATREK
jgi:hypothetical protein